MTSVGACSLRAVPDSCRVYTPEKLAVAMVRSIASPTAEEWLDPCIGEGVFLRALADDGVPSECIVGIDIDTAPRPGDRLAHTERGVDFLSWAAATDRRFSRVVANPPYISLSKLDDVLRRPALAGGSSKGAVVPATGNYWCAFLCASVALIKKGGALCFVVPAAWDYADYAMRIKRWLSEECRELETHRSWTPLFAGVQDGSVVVVMRGVGEPHQSSRRYEYSGMEALCDGLGRAGVVGSGGVSPARPGTADDQVGTRFGDLAEIRLGGVTGDVQYFLMSEQRRLDLGLPETSVRPVVSRASHLVSGSLTLERWNHLKMRGERVWLFDPPEELLDASSVRRYLELAEEDGGCRKGRYKIRGREPWHRTPLPAEMHGFMSGMSKDGPWIALRRMRGLAATNTLYTVRFLASPTLASRAAIGLALLTSSVRRSLRKKGRIYPDGLVKLEPGDLIDLVLPRLSTRPGVVDAYHAAVDALLVGDECRARLIADEWPTLDPQGSRTAR